MNKFNLIGYTAIFFILSAGIILYHTDIAEAIYSIPPTIAIKSIFVGSDPNNNVTADSYAGNTTFIEGTGITITPDFANNELTFTATGGAAGTLESLTNVTDVGCATGQVRKVSGANWVCANDDTGAGATTLDALTDVTLTSPAYKHILQYNLGLTQWVNKIFSIDSQTALSDYQIIGINNQSGAITVNQFSVNTEDAGYFNRIKSINNATGQITYDTIDFIDTTTCGGTQKISAVNNVTGVVTCTNDEEGPIPATTLDGLTDVTITSAGYNDILQYRAGSVNQWIDKLFTIKTQSAANDFQVTGIDNQTGIITTNQFSVNLKTCSGTDKISAIDNLTGNVVCSTDSGVAAAITSINGDTTAAQFIVRGNNGNITVSNSTNYRLINTGHNVVVTGGSAQTFTKNLDFGASTTQKFPTAGMIIRNPASTFAYTVSGGAIAANRTINIPVTTITSSFAIDKFANDFNGFVQKLSTTFLMRDSDSTHAVTIASPNLSSNLTLNIPLATITPSSFAIDKFANDHNGFTQKFSPSILIRNPASTFAYTVSGGAIVANRTLNLPLTTATQTLAILPTTSALTNATVQTTTSATLVFAGRSLAITPVVTGNIRVHYTGYSSSNTLLDGCTLAIREGTGSFPRAGAAVSGTAVGIDIIATSATANANVPFGITYVLTGLTVGTATWFEPVFSAAIGGTCSLRSTMMVLQEY